ncbi:MAG: adenylosuccinate synthase [Myxococcales bacterium]|nr:adenylosuccinate synthase [Myxococcales bacterium]
MAVTAVVGAQWGDEGKGRVVDYLAQRADMVIRFQGGDNAGHTVINHYGTFKLHMIPSGIFNPKTRCVIGAGTVVNPANLLGEIEEVEAAGVSLDNLYISERAHVVLPYHPKLDGLEESAREGGSKIGTTKRGIGPTYADKAARSGVRMGDLKRPGYLRERLAMSLERKNRTLAHFGMPPLDLDEMVETCLEWGRVLGDRIVDTLPMVQEAVRGGHYVLLEGQLGVMRDLDWGIYPYVTSSNPTAGAVFSGAGVPPTALTEVIGVVKAYSTAVGGGPFPVELLDADGEKLRDVGKEYGATTGRPRRCGWFDGVAIKYASWLNGFSSLAITKLDVLDDFDVIKVCVAYELDGEQITRMPDTPDLERVTPVYEEWAGWKQSTQDARTWDDLPKAARAFLHRIAELAEVPFRYVSVGPERRQLVVLDTFGVEGVKA